MKIESKKDILELLGHSENAEIDKCIRYINLADDLEPMVSFNPGHRFV